MSNRLKTRKAKEASKCDGVWAALTIGLLATAIAIVALFLPVHSSVQTSVRSFTPTSGLVGFWWHVNVNDGRVPGWAFFNATTGRKVDDKDVGYSLTEDRRGQNPRVHQYGSGNQSNSLVTIVNPAFNLSIDILWEHNVDTGVNRQVLLGDIPMGYEAPRIVTYDPLYNRYVAATAGGPQAIVVIDATTGAITPLTPNGEKSPFTGTVMDIIPLAGSYVVSLSQTPAEAFIFFDRESGNYTGVSPLFSGTFEHTGSNFIPWTLFGRNPYFTGLGYDQQNTRLYFVTYPGGVGSVTNRKLGYTEADTEEQLLANLMANNFTAILLQYQPREQINALEYINV